MRPNCWCAFSTAASTAALLPTSSASGRNRSPDFAFRSSSEPMLRAAAATLSPRASAAAVHTCPKPLDAPVMNQTFREADWGRETAGGMDLILGDAILGETEPSPFRVLYTEDPPLYKR